MRTNPTNGLYKLRYKILERDNYTCQLCGKAAPEVKLEIDHIVPVANGGTNDESNLRATCYSCNRGKGGLVVNGHNKHKANQHNVIQTTSGKGKLAGKCFHRFDNDGYVSHQGVIREVINDEFIVVQYFDWFIGQLNRKETLPLNSIAQEKWALYNSAEEMRDHYECGFVKTKSYSGVMA